MASDDPTVEEFQENFPDIFSNASASTTTEDVVIQTLPWPFCFYYNNSPWWRQSINAPSPETAAITAENIVQLLNKAAPTLGYQPLFSAVAGDCP